MQSKSLFHYTFPFLACLLWLLPLLSACNSSPERAAPETTKTVTPLNICYGSTLGTLFMVAEDKGFFEEQELPVNLILKKIGRANVSALNDGSCDIAIAAETPVVRNSFSRDDFKILGTIAQSRNLNRVITFSDTGIKSDADLKGRHIATATNSSFHFFLDVLLNKHGMTERDIKLEGMKGAELIPALENRTVDAIVLTDMHATRLKEKFGDAINIIGVPGLNLNYGYLLASRSIIEQEPGKIEKLLAAMLKAENYVKKQAAETRLFYGKQTGLKPENVEMLWADRDYTLSFDHVMLSTLEDHAQWMLKRGAIEAERIPNFLNILYVEPLQKLAPKAINLTR